MRNFITNILSWLGIQKNQSGPHVRIIAFGAFDPVDEGNTDFLKQAKTLGDHLLVVVAHDSAIRAYKHRDPIAPETDRLRTVQKLGIADEVIIGRKTADRYHMLGEVAFDILALGYNQAPTNEEVERELKRFGKYNVKVVRLKQHNR